MHFETETTEQASGDAWEPWLADLERSSDAGPVRGVLDDLWRFRFHEHRGLHPGLWDRLFARLVELMHHEDDRIRELADHYTWIVIWHTNDPGDAGRRIATLLPALTQRIARGDVSLLRCVDELAQVEGLADVGPLAVVERWIEALAESPDQALAAGIAYLDSRDDAPLGNHSATQLIGYLNHADDQVRAYAARALGKCYAATSVEPPQMAPLREFVAELTALEIQRPGIAGPFFSNWYDHGLDDFEERSGVDVREWLITILAGRKQPEPDLLRCSNGIDFFAHEIFGSSPEYVRRLIDLGHYELAVEAATEVDEPNDEMLPLLVELGDHAEAAVCGRAAWHLAAQHRHLHAAGEARGFVRRQALGDKAEVWIQLAPGVDESRQAYAAVIFPTSREPFSETEGAAVVDALLPTTIRGELQPFGMPGDSGSPGLWIHGRSANARYSSGALLEFRGDVESRRWERIRIIWHGTPGEWRPGSAS